MVMPIRLSCHSCKRLACRRPPDPSSSLASDRTICASGRGPRNGGRPLTRPAALTGGGPRQSSSPRLLGLIVLGLCALVMLGLVLVVRGLGCGFALVVRGLVLGFALVVRGLCVVHHGPLWSGWTFAPLADYVRGAPNVNRQRSLSPQQVGRSVAQGRPRPRLLAWAIVAGWGLPRPGRRVLSDERTVPAG